MAKIYVKLLFLNQKNDCISLFIIVCIYREIDLNSNAIIRMDGQKTAIINTKINSTQSEDGISFDKLKEFTFDYSYWSFDRYDPGFASQELVYKDLGADVVSDAFEGYNSCIFAYGQTGSGKTYTMMGRHSSL